jgi:uncharacterized delta-60 repeat protein
VEAAHGRVVFAVDPGAGAAAGGGAAATRVVALPDGGAVLVGGGPRQRGFYAAELTPAGLLDPSFGVGGIARVSVDSPPATPLQALRQPDGKLIVIVSGRQTTAFAFGQLLAVRLDADGSLDPTFGSQGIAAVPLAPACGSCTTAALAPDGDLVLTGEGGLLSAALGGDPSAPAQWDVASLTPSGALDQSFGAGGLETIPATDAGGYDVAVLATGEVATLGVADLSSGSGRVAMLSLLGPNGGADRAFNGGSPVALPAGSGATAMLAEPDGTVIAGGTTALYAYTPSGQPDPGFGADGVAALGQLPSPLELLPAAGGDVVALGRLGGAADTLRGVRVTAGGALDTTFGGAGGVDVEPHFGGGIASFATGGGAHPVPPLAQDGFAVHAVAARPDGSYLVAGGVAIDAPTPTGGGRSSVDFAAAALTPAFTPDTGFGGRAEPLRVELGVPPQTTATAAASHAITVRLDVSMPGLTRVSVTTGGRLIAESVLASLAPGAQTLPVELTTGGASLLATRSGLRVTATATARDLVTETARTVASGTLG